MYWNQSFSSTLGQYFCSLLLNLTIPAFRAQWGACYLATRFKTACGTLVRLDSYVGRKGFACNVCFSALTLSLWISLEWMSLSFTFMVFGRCLYPERLVFIAFIQLTCWRPSTSIPLSYHFWGLFVTVKKILMLWNTEMFVGLREYVSNFVTTLLGKNRTQMIRFPQTFGYIVQYTDAQLNSKTCNQYFIWDDAVYGAWKVFRCFFNARIKPWSRTSTLHTHY